MYIKETQEFIKLFDELTEVKESNVHGLGLFAKKDIPKGTVWWQGINGINIILINKSQYHIFRNSVENNLSSKLWEIINIYQYYSSSLDSLVVCLDNSRFVNHSDNPNSGSDKISQPLVSIAKCDINKGEEIFENYGNYEICQWEGVRNFDKKRYAKL
ncbi:MAG: SET domain-containing protein-lysine N-methyltransferase [Desulfobacterales bacterium]|nr:SET domain-containing protein-lysine N-methyltransferase [Desulfobacterales bacterium]